MVMYRTKPFLAYTPEEKQDFFTMVQKAIKSGTTMVLGYKRCFLCGDELGEISDTKTIGSSSEGPKIITHLCDRCFRESGQ